LTPDEGKPGGGPTILLDSLEVRYRLFPLLKRKLDIREAKIAGLRAEVTQRPDSLWDVLLPFQGPNQAKGGKEEEGRFRLGVGVLQVSNASMKVNFASEGVFAGEDRLDIEELGLSLVGLEMGPEGLTARLDTLQARFLPPGETVDRGVVEGRASFIDGRLVVPGFTLRSGASNASAAGTLFLPRGEGEEVEDIDFQILADSLAFRDLSGFVRTLDPAVSARVDLSVRGRASQVELSGNAALSDGGQVELNGTFTPFTSGAVRYSLATTVAGFRLESVLGEGSLGGVAVGRASIEVEGPDLAHLDGEMSARIEGVLLGGLTTRPLVVSGGLLDGQAQLEVEAGAEGLGAAVFSVVGRPFDPQPTLLIQGVLRQDGSLAEPMEVLSGLRGFGARFALETKGFSPDSAIAELKMETLAGSYRGLALEGGDLRASWNAGDGAFQLSQPVGTGGVTSAGELDWKRESGADGDAMRILNYSVSDLQLRGIDLLRLLGDTVPSQVNANVAISGSGLDPGTLRAAVSIQVQESDFGVVAFDRAVGRLGWEAGAFSAEAEGWLRTLEEQWAVPEGNEESGEGGGRVVVAARGRPFDTGSFLVLDSLSFFGIDLAAFGGLSSELNGVARGRMDGLDLQTGAISGEIDLLPSRLGGTPVDSGSVLATLTEGDLELSGGISSSEGNLRLRGSASPFAEPMAFRVEEGTVRDLNLGPFLGQERLRTNLNLDVGLNGSGPTLNGLEAQGSAVFLPSTLNEGHIQEGRFTLEAGEGLGSLVGQVRTDEGEIGLSASASLSDGLNDVRAEIDVNLPDLGRFFEWSEVEVQGNTILTWPTSGHLAFSSELQGRVRGAVVDSLTLLGSFAESVLQLDTLHVRSEILEAGGSGRFALKETPEGRTNSDLRLVVGALDLASLGSIAGIAEFIDGDGRGELYLTGPAGEPSLEASLELGPWLFRNLSGDSARVVASYEPEEVTLAMWALASRKRGSLDMALRADPGPDQKHGVLERLDIQTPEARWGLETEAPFSWRDGSRIDGFVLASHDSRISVDGGIDPRGDQDLTLTLENARILGITRLFGLEDLDLWGYGRLDLTGPASSPRADGDLTVMLASPSGDSTSVETRFRLADGELTLEAEAEDLVGGRLTLNGAFPLALSLAPDEDPASPQAVPSPLPASANLSTLDVTLRSEAFDISWAKALIPGGAVAALAGVLTADARATGTLAEPVLEGRIALRDGMIRLPALGATFREINASAELQAQEILITRAFMTSASGTLDAQGSVAFQEGEVKELGLTAELDRFVAMDTPTVTATLTGGLSLAGSAAEPLLTGNLVLEGSKIALDNAASGGNLEVVELTEEDYQMLEDYFGYWVRHRDSQPSEFLNRLGMDLSLSFDRDLRVTRSRKPRVSLEARGNLEIEKEPLGEPIVIGTVRIIPERSYFREFGRRFSVQEGELNLNGNPSDYSFRLDSQWEVPSHSNPEEPEVVIGLLVEGDANTLDLTLSSDPEMDEADIVSYLAIGKPQSDLASSGHGDSNISGLGASMAFGAVAGALEEFAGDAVDLDVVEIRADPLKGMTLIAGRYVSPNLYLGLRQPVTFSESSKRDGSQNQHSEVEVEYRWAPWLSLSFQTGADERRLFLRARYAY
jgi:translocation and assembly module TamB